MVDEHRAVTAIAEQRSEIDAIVANRETPTFDNTIAAMERAGLTLDRVESMYLAANVSLGVGAAALGTGIVLFLTGSSSSSNGAE